MFNSNFDKDKVFGVKEASEGNTEDMELRYELDDDQEGDPNYLRACLESFDNSAEMRDNREKRQEMSENA